jgi:hypothetical protein
MPRADGAYSRMSARSDASAHYVVPQAHSAYPAGYCARRERILVRPMATASKRSAAM